MDQFCAISLSGVWWTQTFGLNIAHGYRTGSLIGQHARCEVKVDPILSLRKVAIWMSKNYQKFAMFSEKIAKSWQICLFFSLKTAIFLLKKWQFLAIFLNGKFLAIFDIQMANIRRVRSDWHIMEKIQDFFTSDFSTFWTYKRLDLFHLG